MSFEFEGLDDLINRLDTIEKKVPEGINKLKLVVTSNICITFILYNQNF